MCAAPRATGLVDLVHHPKFKTTRKHNVLGPGLFRWSGDGKEALVLLGALEITKKSID